MTGIGYGYVSGELKLQGSEGWWRRSGNGEAEGLDGSAMNMFKLSKMFGKRDGGKGKTMNPQYI